MCVKRYFTSNADRDIKNWSETTVIINVSFQNFPLFFLLFVFGATR